MNPKTPEPLAEHPESSPQSDELLGKLSQEIANNASETEQRIHDLALAIEQENPAVREELKNKTRSTWEQIDHSYPSEEEITA